VNSTPLWVPRAVAIVGVFGTVGGTIAGVLLNQRRADKREADTWRRESKREKEQWASSGRRFKSCQPDAGPPGGGDAGSGRFSLTATPPEDGASCSTIWVDLASGTSNASLTLT